MAQQIALVRSDGQEAALRPPLAQATQRRALDGAVKGLFVCLSTWFGATIETTVLHSNWWPLYSPEVDREEFEGLVGRAIASLPLEFQRKLENVDIVVEEWPTQAQLRRAKARSPRQLLGLYQGVPQTRRGRGYGLVLPDKISIFQRAIEIQCRSGYEIEAKVGEVVRHEIAHHFGLDDETLRDIERGRRNR